MKTYLNKLNSENFGQIFEVLNKDEVTNFIEDILTGSIDALSYFQESKISASDEYSFYWLIENFNKIIDVNHDIFEMIFRRAISKLYNVDIDIIINKILTITTEKKNGLSDLFILSALNNQDVKFEYKIELALVLDEISVNKDVSFMLNAYLSKDQNYILPALISSIDLKNNIGLLQDVFAKEITQKDALLIDYLDTILHEKLYEYLKSLEDYRITEFSRFKLLCKQYWIYPIIENILSRNDFSIIYKKLLESESKDPLYMLYSIEHEDIFSTFDLKSLFNDEHLWKLLIDIIVEKINPNEKILNQKLKNGVVKFLEISYSDTSLAKRIQYYLASEHGLVYYRGIQELTYLYSDECVNFKSADESLKEMLESDSNSEAVEGIFYLN